MLTQLLDKCTFSGRGMQFSFIGYDMQEVTVGNQSTINVTLGKTCKCWKGSGSWLRCPERRHLLEPYRDKTDDIVSTKQADAVASLQGKSGLLIRQASTKPEVRIRVKLRGYGAPMIVVDGVVRSGAVLRKPINGAVARHQQ